MPVTRHPPRRSQHAQLTHWAPTSGNDAQALAKIRLLLRGSSCSSSSLATCRTRLGAFCKAAWCCFQALVFLTKFPLGSPLASTTSAAYSSILSLYVPLSTLQPWHYCNHRMTLGRYGSLLLHRMELSSTTHCRF